MDFIEWNEAAIVNHVTMDREHKKMVEDINKLFSLVTDNKVEKATKLLLKVVDDFKVHFNNEHEFMLKSKIPQYISHKLEHERFYNKIRDLLLRINSGKEALTIDHLKIVKIWYFNHLAFKDRPLAKYLNENNIK